MQDRKLYEQILGIESPWYVERVELKLECGQVHVHRERPSRPFLTDLLGWRVG